MGNRASGRERFEKKTIMALWRRTHSYSTMNLKFPGENQKGFKGCSGIYSILLLPNDAFLFSPLHFDVSTSVCLEHGQ